MRDGVWRWATATSLAVALLPSRVAAQGLDPTALLDAPVPVRVFASFLLVGAVGAAFLTLAPSFLQRATDASEETPLQSVGYGLLAFVGVGFLGFVAYNVVVRIPRVGSAAVSLVVVAVVVAWLVLASLGFTVVGTAVTDLVGERRPEVGVVAGAGVSALAWLIPNVGLAVALWVLVAAVGVGGSARRWLHASQSVDVDGEPSD